MEKKDDYGFVGLEERRKHPHIKFEIDRSQDLPSSFLEIDGQRIRFLNVEVKSRPGLMPLVTIQVYAQMLEGEIKGAKGEVQIIHIDESTNGLIGPDEEVRRKGWIGPGGRPDGCPAM